MLKFFSATAGFVVILNLAAPAQAALMLLAWSRARANLWRRFYDRGGAPQEVCFRPEACGHDMQLEDMLVSQAS